MTVKKVPRSAMMSNISPVLQSADLESRFLGGELTMTWTMLLFRGRVRLFCLQVLFRERGHVVEQTTKGIWASSAAASRTVTRASMRAMLFAAASLNNRPCRG